MPTELELKLAEFDAEQTKFKARLKDDYDILDDEYGVLKADFDNRTSSLRETLNGALATTFSEISAEHSSSIAVMSSASDVASVPGKSAATAIGGTYHQVDIGKNVNAASSAIAKCCNNLLDDIISNRERIQKARQAFFEAQKELATNRDSLTNANATQMIGTVKVLSAEMEKLNDEFKQLNSKLKAVRDLAKEAQTHNKLIEKSHGSAADLHKRIDEQHPFITLLLQRAVVAYLISKKEQIDSSMNPLTMLSGGRWSKTELDLIEKAFPAEFVHQPNAIVKGIQSLFRSGAIKLFGEERFGMQRARAYQENYSASGMSDGHHTQLDGLYTAEQNVAKVMAFIYSEAEKQESVASAEQVINEIQQKKADPEWHKKLSAVLLPLLVDGSHITSQDIQVNVDGSLNLDKVLQKLGLEVVHASYTSPKALVAAATEDDVASTIAAPAAKALEEESNNSLASQTPTIPQVVSSARLTAESPTTRVDKNKQVEWKDRMQKLQQESVSASPPQVHPKSSPT